MIWVRLFPLPTPCVSHVSSPRYWRASWSPCFVSTFNVSSSLGPHRAFSVLFGGGGALSYLTFGSKVNTVVLVNLDQTSKLTQSVSLSQWFCRWNLTPILSISRSNSCTRSPSSFLFPSSSSLPCEFSRMDSSCGAESKILVWNGSRTCFASGLSRSPLSLAGLVPRTSTNLSLWSVVLLGKCYNNTHLRVATDQQWLQRSFVFRIPSDATLQGSCQDAHGKDRGYCSWHIWYGGNDVYHCVDHQGIESFFVYVVIRHWSDMHSWWRSPHHLLTFLARAECRKKMALCCDDK